jgi:hypothetical protein
MVERVRCASDARMLAWCRRLFLVASQANPRTVLLGLNQLVPIVTFTSVCGGVTRAGREATVKRLLLAVVVAFLASAPVARADEPTRAPIQVLPAFHAVCGFFVGVEPLEQNRVATLYSDGRQQCRQERPVFQGFGSERFRCGVGSTYGVSWLNA